MPPELLLLLLIVFIAWPLIEWLLRGARQDVNEPYPVDLPPAARRPAPARPMTAGERTPERARHPATPGRPQRFPTTMQQRRPGVDQAPVTHAGRPQPPRDTPRRRRGLTAATAPEPWGRRSSTPHTGLVGRLRDPRDLRQTILLMAILGPCKGLRNQ